MEGKHSHGSFGTGGAGQAGSPSSTGQLMLGEKELLDKVERTAYALCG